MSASRATVLGEAEADAIAVLDLLLGTPPGALRRRPRRTLPQYLDDEERPGAALAAIAARRLGLAGLHWMLAGGGYRSRTVLRGGRRLVGRMWDPALNEGFELRYTPASRALWLVLARALPDLLAVSLRPHSAAAGERVRRRLVKQMFPTADTASGDWLFFALADRNLPKLAIPPELQTAISSGLRANSPLAALIALDGGSQGRNLSEETLSRLLAPRAVRILECLEEPLLTSWQSAIEAGLLLDESPTQAAAHASALAARLTAYLEALNRAERTDLAGPLLRLAAWLPTAALFRDAGALRARAAALPGIRSIADRDRVLGSIAELLDLPRRLLDLARTLAAQRYGDPRWEEAQVYLRLARDLLPPTQSDQSAALRRALIAPIG